MEKDKKFVVKKNRYSSRERVVREGRSEMTTKTLKKERREEFKKIELQVKRRNKRINFNYK